MQPKPSFENCSKAYIRVRQTATGYTVAPANIAEFDRAQGVGTRLESDLVAMPQEATLTSIAISMARIADEAETIRHIALMGHLAYKKANRSIWRKIKDGYYEAMAVVDGYDPRDAVDPEGKPKS